MDLSIINTFTKQAFKGNPAAVCMLSEEKETNWMQKVTREINLPTTVFINFTDGEYYLRWFTPSNEISICGHGTLASSFYLWEKEFVAKDKTISFHTKSGILKANYINGWVQLEFPALIEKEASPSELLLTALDITPTYVGKNKLDYIVEVKTEDIVKKLKPNIDLISQLPARGVIVTSQSNSK
ncbi:MAG: PhzF family phenazine biosynthesis protein [Bacillota bacterium]